MSDLEKRVELLEYKLNKLLKLLSEKNIIDYEDSNNSDSDSDSDSDDDICKNEWCNNNYLGICNDCGIKLCEDHIYMKHPVEKTVTYCDKEYKEFKNLNLCNKCLETYNK